MEKLNLNAQVRDTEEKLSIIRAAKMIPAVVYWKKQEPIAIQVEYSEFLKLFRVSWESHIITLNIDKTSIDVLVHDIQRDPIQWGFKHLDFLAVTKGEKVHTKIQLTFIGESKAVKEGAILEEHIKEIDVKVLPQDLVDSIEVDLSKLEENGSNLRISDLAIDLSKFELLTNSNDIVASVALPSKAEALEEATVEVETEDKEQA